MAFKLYCVIFAPLTWNVCLLLKSRPFKTRAWIGFAHWCNFAMSCNTIDVCVFLAQHMGQCC